jgi:hypothetical protein
MEIRGSEKQTRGNKMEMGDVMERDAASAVKEVVNIYL